MAHHDNEIVDRTEQQAQRLYLDGEIELNEYEHLIECALEWVEPRSVSEQKWSEFAKNQKLLYQVDRLPPYKTE